MLHCCIATTVVLEPAICEDLDLHVAIFIIIIIIIIIVSPSGLSCYACNKLFTIRDLIENHYKTVKHQLECKKLQKLDERTTPDEEIRRYRRGLLKINGFAASQYKGRTWIHEKTV